ncbi:MAG: apolipoprotein N-acyltransferase [Acidimicrobiales bacterium mtb01]|nr:apolipoprotein N-acyltransferase [Actinomycetota bacterium]TEX45856.1 MAG: apolipoprotein N-acyltransferase [Acidimicrobiales bacterium mtb01]
MTRGDSFSRRRVGWSLVAGLLVAASMPPWGWWPLSFVGLAMLARLELTTPRARDRFVIATVAGLGWFVPALSWMWFLTAPGYLIAALIFAVLHGVASAAAGAVDRDMRVVALPAAHTLVEALRLSFPFGGVPLATLGIAQVAGPLDDIARVGGVVLLTWVTWQIGALLVRRSGSGPAFRTARRVAIITVVVIFFVAINAPRGSDLGRAIDIAAVQGGGPQGTRAIDTDPRDVVERHLAATRLLVDEGRSPDLVVWPENVIDVPDFETSVELTEVASFATRLDAPFLVGITEDVDSESFTNAQVVVEPSSERVIDRYDKVRRVPFGEYMPLRGLLDSVGAPVDLVPRDAVAGTGPAVLLAPNVAGSDLRAAVVISWEVFFGGRAREGVKNGGELIINPTNGSSYTWTVLQTQQIASSRLRAIETGRWVVQVAPTGFSAFVSPSGHVYDRTAVSEQVVISRSIPLRSGDTLYTSIGDGPWIAAVGAVLAMTFVRRIRLRSRR